ncbi:MAG: DoxX family protein [Candidatus Acidiferrales bacterium]
MPRVCGAAAEVSAPIVRPAANGNYGDIGRKAIACVRIATGIIFSLFAEYKIAGSEFTPAGFEHWVRGWVEQGQVVGFYRTVLVNIALAHPVLCSRMVAWSELGIAVSLILGLLVRPAAIGGVILMLNFILSTWFAPGHGAPVWQYFGANLDHIPLLFLFVIFYATRAGDVWGLDGRLRQMKARAG